MDILKTLNTLNACFGPSGREDEVREAIKKLAKPFADEMKTDAMGNLYVRKKGNGAKVMFSAHMDSIGIIATVVEDEGFIRFGRVGGISPATLLSSTVRFANGTRGVVQKNEDAKLDKLTLQEMYIDIGVANKEEALKHVQPGDMAVYDAPSFLTPGGMIVSPYLDDRICCVAQLMALEKLKKTDNDVWFVFTVQEEVGLRGAKTAGYIVDPDYFVVCDVTWSDDTPKAEHFASSVTGKGAAIKIMDGSVIAHPQVVKLLNDIAKQKKIKVQQDVLKGGGTDAGAIHVSKAGVPSSGVSVPIRYCHYSQEMAALSDVEDTAKLLAAFAENKF